MKYAPVVLFAYNRLNEVRQTVEALKQNILAPQSDLYIFSDNAKSESDQTKVAAVRDFLHTIDGFKSVTVIERERLRSFADTAKSSFSKMTS